MFFDIVKKLPKKEQPAAAFSRGRQPKIFPQLRDYQGIRKSGFSGDRLLVG
jgi:hypothetical protein